MNRDFFAYIRVSTARQGQRGVSLQEQRDAIERFAAREGLTVSAWFEERETAAKRGRTQFVDMLDRLRRGDARGVLIHKIDRSARNLRDWADLGELLDAGTEVRFVTESLDMASRGGRLSADIQAVVAADYIRNLREETKKGFYGRLKQGFLPLAAPLGYLDNGGGKLKTPDPERAPLVRQAFELYATGSFTLDTLCEEMRRRGLRSRGGRALRANRMSVVLNNPFYAGLIRIATTGEEFPGKHEALIDPRLYERVQDILTGRCNVRLQTHDFRFKRLLRCAWCSRQLTGERQRGHIYYRCHSKTCRGVSIREENIDTAIARRLEAIALTDDDVAMIKPHLPQTDAEWAAETKAAIGRLRAQIARNRSRLDQLTDALIDRLIDRDTFEARRAKLVRDINLAEQDCKKFEHRRDELKVRIEGFVERWRRLHTSYIEADNAERRDLLLTVSSNRLVRRKNLELELFEPFKTIENELVRPQCGHRWKNIRTLFEEVCEIIRKKVEREAEELYPYG